MKRFLSIAAVLFLISAGAALAQTGGVTGIVVDQDGNPVEGARVSLWLEDTCQGHIATDAAGVFLFEDVPIGTYTLKAGKPKVGKAVLEGVVVIEGQVTEVGTLTLVGSGPNGPNGSNKYKYQQQNQNQEGQEE